MAITDLSTDFSDGLVLINLLEILSGKSVGRYALMPKSRFLRIENVVIALKFIDQELKLRLYGTSAEGLAPRMHSTHDHHYAVFAWLVSQG
jgi:hypothetical protein